MTIRRPRFTAGLCTLALLAACGGDRKAESDADSQPTPGAVPGAEAGGGSAAAYSTTQLTPESGRKVVTVQMETDEQGNNRFDPAKVEVHQGDVIRFTLKSGVHNVHFVADSNPNARGLPTQPSDMLQLPGQTLDLKVSWAPGTHFFQCDPHALLGMVGHVEVED
jgi:plastocyanin